MEYLLANGIGALIWLFLFYRRKDLQKEMLLNECPCGTAWLD